MNCWLLFLMIGVDENLLFLMWRNVQTRFKHSQTLVEKIVQKYTIGDSMVSQGDFVSIQPHRIMTHDNTGPVISKFNSIGAPKVKNPDQVVFTLDHDVQNKSKGVQLA